MQQPGSAYAALGGRGAGSGRGRTGGRLGGGPPVTVANLLQASYLQPPSAAAAGAAAGAANTSGQADAASKGGGGAGGGASEGGRGRGRGRGSKSASGAPASLSGLGGRGGVLKTSGRGSGGRGGAAAALAAGLVPDVPEHFHGMFSADLRPMMYAFGDAAQPLQEAVDLVEDILVEFVTEVAGAALDNAISAHSLDRARADDSTARFKTKLEVEDLRFVMRKDDRKFRRIRELMLKDQEIKEVRKAFKADADPAAANAAAATATAAATEPADAAD